MVYLLSETSCECVGSGNGNGAADDRVGCFAVCERIEWNGSRVDPTSRVIQKLMMRLYVC